MQPYPPEGMENPAVTVTMPINDELAAYLEENLIAFRQVIGTAMSLQIIHGLSMKEAVAQAMREVTE